MPNAGGWRAKAHFSAAAAVALDPLQPLQQQVHVLRRRLRVVQRPAGQTSRQAITRRSPGTTKMMLISECWRRATALGDRFMRSMADCERC